MDPAILGSTIGVSAGVGITAYVYTSFVVIDTGEVGVVKRFGKLTGKVLEPGLGRKVPLIDHVVRYPTITQEEEFPADPELVEKADEDNVPPGKKPPFRILQTGARTAVFYVKKTQEEFDAEQAANPQGKIVRWKTVAFGDLSIPREKWEAMENDPLEQPITTEVQFVVEWRIDKDSVLDFATNVKTIKQALRRMEDTVARALQEYMGPTTAGHAQEQIAFISEEIQNRLMILVGQIEDPATGRKRTPAWGVVISNAYIKSIDPGKTVNMARAKAAAAVGAKIEVIELAEANTRKIELEAKANAYKTVQEGIASARNIKVKADADAFAEKRSGEGQRDRIKTMSEAMKEPYAIQLLQIEASERVLGKVGTTVVSGDLAGIIGSLTKAAQAVTTAPSNPPPENPQVQAAA
ncbi:MAG: hypothetical protein JWN50_397 [Parcubacteria group bacterium]|nr:hypothetical protein [Parcubacteria group bacterium]